MTATSDAIVSAVQLLYEQHPYPRYPLLARPRWQDGYLANSGLATSLAKDLFGVSTPPSDHSPGQKIRILIGGAGEILPYIVRKWEPSTHHVVSLDLSLRSLRRARIRLLTSLKRTEFIHDDLDHYLSSAAAGSFTHIDAYGVLHHMSNPGTTLTNLNRRLAPGGTLRLMVYNSVARRFITHFQRALALLGLTPASNSDIASARRLLMLIARDAPALSERLRQIGQGTRDNDARFADLFMHPREARLSADYWWQLFATAGLRPIALFDRYGELDDLPNPLWQIPITDQLLARIDDRRFENNLELFLMKPAGLPHVTVNSSVTAHQPLMPTMSRGPRLWYSFSETASLTMTQKIRLWRAHRAWTERRQRLLHAKDFARLPERAIARLARLGAILPGQIADDALRRIGLAPLETTMEPPPHPGPSLPMAPAVEQLITSLIQERGLPSHRRAAIVARLNAARD